MVLVEIDEEDQEYPYLFSDKCWRTVDGMNLVSREKSPLDIIGEWTPNDEITLLEAQLAEADAKRAEAQAALAAARKAKAEAERKPWEPKGGEWAVCSGGVVIRTESEEPWRRAGAEYPTRESAEAARDRIVFFQRMCALATELNPSGKVGGCFYTYLSSGKWRVNASTELPHLTMFETLEAAEAACEIMNRDKREVPG